jgi:hypothetical protein
MRDKGQYEKRVISSFGLDGERAAMDNKAARPFKVPCPDGYSIMGEGPAVWNLRDILKGLDLEYSKLRKGRGIRKV